MAHPKYIQTKRKIQVVTNGAAHDIGENAVGILSDSGTHYNFRNIDCIIPHGETPRYLADKLMNEHGHEVEAITMAGAVHVEPNPATKKAPLTRLDISTELWREYRWNDPSTAKEIVKRFENPIAVYVYTGCTTHRVVTAKDGIEVTTIVPSIGHFGCIIQFGNKDGVAAPVH
jgi:hypothetical protein